MPSTQQSRCRGTETALGPVAYNKASDAVKLVFGTARKRAGLTYEVAIKELADNNDSSAKAAKALESSGLLKPATPAVAPFSFPNRPTGPAKPAGFA